MRESVAVSAYYMQLMLIRKRRGAFNSKQLLYLENYKPKLCLRSKDANGQLCCIQ